MSGAKIEIMIPEGQCIVGHEIHGLDVCFAAEYRRHGSTDEQIAAVHQKHQGRLFAYPFDECSPAGHAALTLVAALLKRFKSSVMLAGMENRDGGLRKGEWKWHGPEEQAERELNTWTSRNRQGGHYDVEMLPCGFGGVKGRAFLLTALAGACYRPLAHAMHEHLLQLIDAASPYVDEYGYLILFLGVMAENASLPVPGETILIIASFYSYLGNLSLAHVIPLAIVGCILGDNISFYLGRRLGRPFVLQYGKYLFITPQRLSYVEKFFYTHGDKTIFVQRWITGVRVIGALVAGTTKMPWPRFLLFNCLGAIAWVTAIALLGYFFAMNLPLLVTVLSRSGWTLLGLVGLIALIFYLKRRYAVDENIDPCL